VTVENDSVGNSSTSYVIVIVVATESMNWGTELWVSLADQNLIFPPEKLLFSGVTDDNQVIFTHQTYAECFACVWLKNNLDKVSLL
jgi:hypothetical protein